MTVSSDYVQIPVEEVSHRNVDSGNVAVQEIARQHICNKHCLLSCAIKGTFATGGAIGGAAKWSIPTIVCLAITYLGLELSGDNSLAPGHGDVDMTKVGIGIILTLGGGFAALLTMFTLPIYGVATGGVKGWEKGKQVAEKYLSQPSLPLDDEVGF